MLLLGIINGGGLHYADIHFCGINPFNVHFVKRVKKVVKVTGVPKQMLLFALSFVPSKLDLFTAQQ
jgi:hypothetical protein